MSERGSITLWMVGMMLVVLMVGGVSVDLWRALAAHRAVAAVVDSAAIAAGSGIDELRWREDGLLVLDAHVVAERVAVAVATQSADGSVEVTALTAPDGSSATVRGSTTVELTLLGLVVDDVVEVSATATAAPAISP